MKKTIILQVILLICLVVLAAAAETLEDLKKEAETLKQQLTAERQRLSDEVFREITNTAKRDELTPKINALDHAILINLNILSIDTPQDARRAIDDAKKLLPTTTPAPTQPNEAAPPPKPTPPAVPADTEKVSLNRLQKGDQIYSNAIAGGEGVVEEVSSDGYTVSIKTKEGKVIQITTTSSNPLQVSRKKVALPPKPEPAKPTPAEPLPKAQTDTLVKEARETAKHYEESIKAVDELKKQHDDKNELLKLLQEKKEKKEELSTDEQKELEKLPNEIKELTPKVSEAEKHRDELQKETDTAFRKATQAQEKLADEIQRGEYQSLLSSTLTGREGSNLDQSKVRVEQAKLKKEYAEIQLKIAEKQSKDLATQAETKENELDTKLELLERQLKEEKDTTELEKSIKETAVRLGQLTKGESVGPEAEHEEGWRWEIKILEQKKEAAKTETEKDKFTEKIKELNTKIEEEEKQRQRRIDELEEQIEKAENPEYKRAKEEELAKLEGGELGLAAYRAQQAAYARAEAAREIELQKFLQQNIGLKIVNIMSSLIKSYTEYSGIARLGSLFISEEWLAEQRQKVDQLFCDSILFGGVTCWQSKICDGYIEAQPGGTSLVARGPSGTALGVVHLEAERSLPIQTVDEQGKKTTFYRYKITYSITNPHDKTMTYNIAFTNPNKTVNLFGENKQVQPQKSDGRLGADLLIPPLTTSEYTQACLSWQPSITTWDGKRENNFCVPVSAYFGPPTRPYAEETTTGIQVSIKNFGYNPNILTIIAGDTVTWTNQDTPVQTVTFKEGEETIDSGPLNQGQSFSHKFTTSGKYTYASARHTSVKGTITVKETPKQESKKEEKQPKKEDFKDF